MQTLYPDYYAQFRCTADKCPITCCQEWKISVDDDTLKRWAALNPPVDSKLFTYVQDGQHVIALNSRHVCPFLEKTSSAVLSSNTERMRFPRRVRFSPAKPIPLPITRRLRSCPAVPL